MLIKEAAETAQPLELELIFLRSDHLAIRYVHVDYANTVSRRCHETLRGISSVARVTALCSFIGAASQNRNTVISLLSKQEAVVTPLTKNISWKLIISTLGLLHAEHIRSYFIEPARNIRQSRGNRIHIPGGNLHFTE